MSRPDVETLAETFAAEGREELVVRFREAYANALGTHSDLVRFDPERIEIMVQGAAADADGLQWRRALAAVAARELGIDLGSALTHPAVERAHQLAGAPSYETALGALARPAPLPESPLAPPPPAALPTDEARFEAAVEAAAEAELAAVMPSASRESEPEPGREPEEDEGAEARSIDEDTAEFGAVHLGGVASLPSSEEIALRLSAAGFDLLHDDGTILGRLGWTDIAALEVTVPHGRRRRRNAPRLVVHTPGGSARFEVSGLSGEELQDRVQPLMARFGL